MIWFLAPLLKPLAKALGPTVAKLVVYGLIAVSIAVVFSVMGWTIEVPSWIPGFPDPGDPTFFDTTV